MKFIIKIYGWFLIAIRNFFYQYRSTMPLLFVPLPKIMREINCKAMLYYHFAESKKTVPGYRKFLENKNTDFRGAFPDTYIIPIMDKDNYIKIYDLDSRCVKGKIPDKNVVIDESSGSSGVPTQWVRGYKERYKNAKMIEFGMQNLFGKKPLLIINAFALGAWATGMNITMSCLNFAKVKSTGADISKIESTLNIFGDNNQYVIMGYPPFLKLLTDQAKIDWTRKNVSFILGGESMSEEMRDYFLRKGIKRIYSSFGASDLELNIASENDFTISLRKLLKENTKLKEKIVKYQGALPMVFQYNPSEFYIETSENGELIISLLRSGYISPKIRYNIHDKGHILEIDELRDILNSLNINSSILKKLKSNLPILLHYGRADNTVSFFGSNISPNDISETIYSLPKFAENTNSFIISTLEDENNDKKLIIDIELQKDKEKSDEELGKLTYVFFNRLAEINQDFKASKNMLNNQRQLIIRFHSLKNGIFEKRIDTLKNKYI